MTKFAEEKICRVTIMSIAKSILKIHYICTQQCIVFTKKDDAKHFV